MSIQLEHDLAAVIAKHADQLDGRTWQRTTQLVAEAYFAPEDLAEVIDGDALRDALTTALEL